MAALLLPRGRFVRQPQYRARVDRNHPLLYGCTDLVLPGQHDRTLIRNYRTEIDAGSIITVAGPLGTALRFDGVTDDNNLLLGTRGELFTSTTDCTVFVLRRSYDTTARESTLFGYNITTGNRILAHAPYSDGNLYWDFSNHTVNSGRLVVSGFTKSTQPESLVFIAGGGKGREVWRNGVKIGGSTTPTAAIGGVDTMVVGLGGVSPDGAATMASDLEEVYLFGIVARAWSDAEVREWTRAPWQFFQDSRRSYFLPASAPPPASTARPVVFVCT